MTSFDDFFDSFWNNAQTARKDVYCFVGSGLSRRANIPLMGGVIKGMEIQLKEWARLRYVDEVCVKNFQNYKSEDKWQDAAEVFKNCRASYELKQRFFDDHFLNDKHPDSVHHDLISYGFRGIFTTNYDHLLEDAYASVTGRNILPYVPKDFEKKEIFISESFFIAKLHGDAARWPSIVISHNDYDKITWDTKVCEILRDKVLFVFGVGPSDPLIIDSFRDIANSNTDVYYFANQNSIEQVSTRLRNKYNNNPERFNCVVTEHADIDRLFLASRRGRPPEKVIGCSWSVVPPIVPGHIYFESTYARIRNFLFSPNSVAIIQARNGAGVDSLLAQCLQERANHGNCMTFMIEAKEWLPVDAYALHLLISTHSAVFDDYRAQRHQAAEGWTDYSEGRAVGSALKKLNRFVVIAIYPAERLLSTTAEPSNYMQEFLKGLIEVIEGDNCARIQLILCYLSPNSDTQHTNSRFAVGPWVIDFEAPSEHDIYLLCNQRGLCCSDGIRLVLEENTNANLNTIFLAAPLLNVSEGMPSEIKVAVQANDTKSLCKLVLKKLSAPARNVLKAAILFRTPIDDHSLKTVTGIDSIEAVRTAIAELKEAGCLLSMHTQREPVCYRVGTTLRQDMSELFWPRKSSPKKMAEKRNILRHLAMHFEKQAKDLIELKPDRATMCKAIPYLASALHYYGEACDREAYIKLATHEKIAGLLTNMYHSRVLKMWLGKAPKTPSSDPLLEYRVLNVLGKLARMQSMTKDYAERLKSGSAKLKMARRQLKSKMEAKLKMKHELLELEASHQLEWGIMLTMRRRYSEALAVFKKALKLPGATLRDRRRIELRIVQTQLSLGQIAAADLDLIRIEHSLQNNGQQEGDYHHAMAMACRHRATICILRAGLDHLRPAESSIPAKADLLIKAKEAANDCYTHSQNDQGSPHRFGLPDETGMGIARFKRAHACFLGEDYPNCIRDLEEAVKMLSGYPNSRWWRMCCHDLLSKVYCMQGNFEKAEQELGKALNIWSDSAEEDNVRRAELHYTEGMIHFHQRKYVEAHKCLKKATEFKEISPCILVVHLKWYLVACYAIDDIHGAENARERISKIGIEW